MRRRRGLAYLQGLVTLTKPSQGDSLREKLSGCVGMYVVCIDGLDGMGCVKQREGKGKRHTYSNGS